MRYDLRCPSALKLRIAETPMTKNAVLFVNSNNAHVLIELENLFTVFNYRDAKRFRRRFAMPYTVFHVL